MCQLVEMHYFVETHSWFEDIWQLRKRIPRFINNRLYLIQYQIRSIFKSKSKIPPIPVSWHFEPGDWVIIKTKEEIQSTLNGWKCFEGCRFMDEMWAFCGKKFKIMKNVHRILDERSMKMRKCKNVVILDGLMCNGSWPFGDCDRSCYYLWKEFWLRKSE